MAEDIYDVLVIGGGVNGAGIARDLAGRSARVMLVEAHDLAAATSSASTKIIHGGLRYLEQFDFRLVREALKEREVLLKNAPHIMWQLEFILPHRPHLRPRWMIRIGLFLYDHLAKRRILPGSMPLDLKDGLYGGPLKDDIENGFSYADGWVEDSRLVVLNAMDARARGAVIRSHTECTKLTHDGQIWTAELVSKTEKRTWYVRARQIVNAAGPWALDLLGRAENLSHKKALRLVKGSHIIISKLYEGRHSYILQHDDKRIVFAIPYERDYTLIGTTDVPYEGNPAEAQISPEEVEYLCNIINQYFKKQISEDDVLASFSGVRPLLDDGAKNASKVTRDYQLFFDHKAPPLLSIYGGKITTYRKLAEAAADLIMPGSAGWTKEIPLPGGNMPKGFELFLSVMRHQYPWLSEELLQRYCRAYGTRMTEILGDADSSEELGEHLGDGVYVSEIDYLVQEEMAHSLEDIIWRRSKLILHISEKTRHNIERYLKDKFE